MLLIYIHIKFLFDTSVLIKNYCLETDMLLRLFVTLTWLEWPKIISQPLSSHVLTTYQVSFKYLIPNWSYHLETIFSTVVSFNLDLHGNDPNYNSNPCLHMFYLPTKFCFDTSFLTLKLSFRNHFYIAVRCDLDFGQSDPNYNPNLSSYGLPTY